MFHFAPQIEVPAQAVSKWFNRATRFAMTLIASSKSANSPKDGKYELKIYSKLSYQM